MAVPSHRRVATCNEKTLRLLADRGVDAERVRVFVDPGQVDEYRSGLDPGLHGGVEVGALGTGAQNNAVARTFADGDWVVHADDDLADVVRRLDERTLAPVPDLDRFFLAAFEASQRAACGLWGVYPVANAYFMKPRWQAGLLFCIGQLFGLVNTHAPHGQLELNQKEDYERTLRWFEHDGAVYRCEDVAPRSRMYAPGGMQAPEHDRAALNDTAVRYLCERWPGLVKVAVRQGKAGAEVRLALPRRNISSAGG